MSKTAILLIEDNVDDVWWLRETLAHYNKSAWRFPFEFELEHTDRLKNGIGRLDRGGIDVVLLDLTLPDSAGVDTVSKVFAQASDVPVIVLTGVRDEAVGMQAVQEGAQDFLVKGQFDGNLLVRSIRYARQRHRMLLELNESNQRLQASEARYRAIVEDQTELICRFKADGTLLFVNSAYCRYFGEEFDKLVGTRFMPLVFEEDRILLEEKIASLCAKNPVATCEHRVIAVGGEIRWMQWTNRALCNERGHIVEFQSVGCDVTERKLAEEALKRNALQLTDTVSELVKSKELMEDQNRLLQHLAIHDGLTGLYNHHYFVESIGREISRSLRYGTELSCLMIDMDHFKAINDTFGHAFGDFVLKDFGARLKASTRGSDLCFRHGGEEFLVLLPQTDQESAGGIAERIRVHCENSPYDNAVSRATVTVSIGISSIDHNRPEDSKKLVTHADKALYQAKTDGRNRVRVYDYTLMSPLACH